MEPARLGLEQAVGRLVFHDAAIPIVANCTGEPLTEAHAVKRELVAQITSCVQWKRSVEHMAAAGVTQFIEVGPGKALAGMVKRIVKDASAVSVGDMQSISALKPA
jgi:[acyl-carrier-protein] S-malonyltransferase